MTSIDHGELVRAAEQAARESHPYTDPAANYPTAEQYRTQRAEGAARRDTAR